MRVSSLRLRLLLLVAVAVLPAIGLVSCTVKQWRDHELVDAREQALNTARQLSATYRRRITAAQQMLTSAAPTVTTLPSGRTLQQVLEGILRQASDFDIIGVIGPDSPVVSVGRSMTSDVANHRVLAQAREAGKTVVGRCEIGSSGKPALTVAVPLSPSSGQRSPMMFGVMNLSWLSDDPGDQLLPPGTTVTIFNESGVVLAKTPSSDPLDGEAATGNPLVRLAVARGDEGVADLTPADGVPRLFGFRPISRRGEPSNIYVAVGTTKSAATAQVDRILARDLAALGFTFMLALVAVSVVNERLVAQPVQALIATTHRLRGGDLTARTAAIQGPAELTRLAHAVDGMAAALQAREESISRQHDDLARQARRFRALIEHGSDGIVLLDRDGRFVYASPSTARLLECPMDHLIGRSAGEFVQPDDREAVRQRLGELIQAPRTFLTFTFRVQAVSGACRWVEAEASNLLGDPDVAAIVGRYRDVTDSAQAFEKLSSAVEQSADSVLITDRDGVIEYVNPAFEAMTGYSRKDAIGRTPRLLSSGQTPQRLYRALWNTILSGEVFRATIVNKKKNGQLYDEDQTITPIRDASGNIKHFVSTGRDITQRKRTEEALRRLNAQLEKEATRIAGVLHDEAGQFLTSAHIVLADVARDANPAVRERLQSVRASLDQVEEQLRRVSREIHPRILDDMGLVDAIKFLSDAFGRRTAIRVDVTASFDAHLERSVEAVLYRLVQEGLTNISRHAQATEACVELTNDDEIVTCAIRDNGQGFDPNAVLASRTDGGLGLQLIDDRLAAFGGTLVIRSSPAGGTELRATLPVEG